MRLFPRTRAVLKHAWGAFRADAGLGIVGSPSPDADYWYHGLGYQSAAGPNVSPATATRLSAVFSCTRVCTETLASLPVGIVREAKSGTREAAKDHPAYELFQQPNSWQTGMEFFEMLQGHLELRGNAYALKVTGGGRAIKELIPIHPDRVRVYLLPDRRLRYEVTSYSSGQIDRYSQDEMLHVRGWSFDGIMGVSTVSANAEAIGVGLAQQEHRGRYFRNSAILGLAVEGPKLTPEAAEEMKNSLSEGFSGENAFKAMIVPPGRTVKPLGLTNKDSQLIEASSATRLDICAAWRVPPHKIGDLSRGTFSNIEQQNIEFATDCIRPRVERIERRLGRDVVDALRFQESALGDFFTVFNMDALFRGDMKSRYEAYSQAQFWMTRNEMRRREGLNPIDGLDEPLVAVAYETVDQAETRSQSNAKAATAKANAGSDPDSEEDLDKSGGAPETPGDDPDAAKAQAAHLRALATASAGRLVRREVKALQKLAEHEQPLGKFSAAIDEFYRDFAGVISESLAIPILEAREYTSAHARQLVQSAPGYGIGSNLNHAIERIADLGPAALAALVLNHSRPSVAA